MTALAPCAWCGIPTRDVANIRKGRGLQMVPVCSEHAAMVEGQKAALAAAKQRTAAERKLPAAVPHWRQ